MSWFSKLINETLKNPKTGQWSRKNLAGFAAFVYAIKYLTVAQWLGKPFNIEAFFTLITFAGSMLGISSWEKFNVKKNENNNDPI